MIKKRNFSAYENIVLILTLGAGVFAATYWWINSRLAIGGALFFLLGSGFLYARSLRRGVIELENYKGVDSESPSIEMSHPIPRRKREESAVEFDDAGGDYGD
ncbi:MAG: hypothetical protein H0W44_09650 [Gammaproteobacteria bacterium]|nr:hypothetical protein [Gammaproteobacteria bacterium]